MKLTFIETPVFTELITDLLEDEDYRQMQEYLLIYPTAGNVIADTAGCRKLRWRVSGRKSGGMRVIYYVQGRCESDHIPAGVRSPSR